MSKIYSLVDGESAISTSRGSSHYIRLIDGIPFGVFCCDFFVLDSVSHEISPFFIQKLLLLVFSFALVLDSRIFFASLAFISLVSVFLLPFAISCFTALNKIFHSAFSFLIFHFPSQKVCWKLWAGFLLFCLLLQILLLLLLVVAWCSCCCSCKTRKQDDRFGMQDWLFGGCDLHFSFANKMFTLAIYLHWDGKLQAYKLYIGNEGREEIFALSPYARRYRTLRWLKNKVYLQVF
jgi:hypothetical protein